MNVRIAALSNTELHTKITSQIHVNSIPKSIPEETHHNKTQIIYVEQGLGTITLGETDEKTVFPGIVVIVPPGTVHKIENNDSETNPLKIVSIYI